MDELTGERRIIAIAKTTDGQLVADSVWENSCAIDVSLNEIDLSSGNYWAGSTIQSSISINDNSEVEFRAGNSIHLTPGFEVVDNATFRVSFGECDSEMALLSPSFPKSRFIRKTN